MNDLVNDKQIHLIKKQFNDIVSRENYEKDIHKMLKDIMYSEKKQFTSDDVIDYLEHIPEEHYMYFKAYIYGYLCITEYLKETFTPLIDYLEDYFYKNKKLENKFNKEDGLERTEI